MTCSPDFCDLHDYDVHPGSGWCRAVDVAYGRRQNKPRLDSHDGILAEAIFRLADVLDKSENRPTRYVPPTAAPKPQARRGGTPL